MNRNRMLLLAGIALVLSAGVTYLAYRVLQTRLQPAEKTTQVVVANKKLGIGTLITKEDIQLAEWPKSTPLTGSFSDPAQVVDRALLIPVEINEPILESKLAPKEAGAGLAAIIPEGMRALSIQVNSIIGVSGFVLPGSRVDLILTAVPPSDVKGAKGNETATKIILENLEVIAAGQSVQRDVNGQPQSVQNVTLLLTPEQSEKVALATGDGRIQLALRNPMDKEAAEPPLVVRSALYTGPTMERPKGEKEESSSEKTEEAKKPVATPRVASVRRRPPPKPPEAVPPPTPETRVVVIELIRGSNRAKQTFEGKTPEPTETPTLPDRIQQ